jgi:hypothetical protein
MLLTDENYYSKEADSVYMSCSQYKTWTQCEALGFAKYVSGEYEKLEQSGVISRDKTALIMGNFVGTKWESEDAHEQFKLEHPEILSTRGATKGQLKTTYKLGELMYERTVKDPLFKRSMTGEHEKIITFEMFGVKWKCRLDLINLDNKCITDLKTTQNFKETYGSVHGQQGYLPFYEIWRYPLQLAIYQKAGLIEYGITFDMFISVVTKEKIPNFDVLDFDATEWDDRFKYELDLIETNLPRILKVKNKEDMPERCEECEYCIATKVLTQPTIVHSYFNIPEDEDFELDLNN